MQDSLGIQDFYIKRIHIDKVRHLENIDIDIAGDTRKHLILTGKNGSGKTSLLIQLNMVLRYIWELNTYPVYSTNPAGLRVFASIMPFLTKMFPRIQFIVTTHSPFVITSLSDAVVYDLEKQISVEDMSAYSYEAVIEHYYDVDMYSEKAGRQFEMYKSLVAKENRSPEETELLASVIAYLKQVPAGAARELVFAFREMESYLA